MRNFIEERLSQLPPIGAILGNRRTGSLIWISTVKFGDDTLWTRATNEDGSIMVHFEGNIPTEDAALKFAKLFSK